MKRKSILPKNSKLETTLTLQMHANELTCFIKEYRFHPKRRWRFDFADPVKMIALEVEGGTFKTSRHTTGTGFHNDCEKYNTATIMGWKVLRFDSKMITSGKAIECIIRCLEVSEHDPNMVSQCEQ